MGHGKRIIEFLPQEGDPTDEQLLLQLAYGICISLKNSSEERMHDCMTAFEIPTPFVRRVAKLLIKRCNLPVPESRVDLWVDFIQDKDLVDGLTDLNDDKYIDLL